MTGILALAVAGCAQLPQIGGMALPRLTQQDRNMYRNLADIPEAPPVTATDVNDSAIRVLSQERAATERAADELRGEPFMTPGAAPPIMPF